MMELLGWAMCILGGWIVFSVGLGLIWASFGYAKTRIDEKKRYG